MDTMHNNICVYGKEQSKKFFVSMGGTQSACNGYVTIVIAVNSLSIIINNTALSSA